MFLRDFKRSTPKVHFERKERREGEGKFSPNPGNTMMVVEGHQQRQLQRPNKSQKHRLQLFPNSCNKQPAFAL